LKAGQKYSELGLHDFLQAHKNDLILSVKERPVVFLLEGELGVGKSSFVAEFLKCFGFPKYLGSPTYPVAISYAKEMSPGLGMDCVHVDLYRIKDAEELIERGLEELFLEPKTILFIEWPSRLGEMGYDRNQLFFAENPSKDIIHLHWKSHGLFEITQL